MRLDDYWQFNNSKVFMTLRETSADDSDKNCIQYMTASLARVICFDLVKREYLNSHGMSEESAMSIDALFQINTASKEDDFIYMVEFKNGEILSRDIERKARDSVLIYQSITGTQLEDTRKHVNFILVYNDQKHPMNYRDKRALAKASQGREDFSRFGLHHLRGFCFKRVFVFDQNQFEKRIVPLIC